MHVVTLAMQKFQAIIKKEPIFSILQKLHLILFLSGLRFSCKFFLHALIYSWLQGAVYKEIASHKTTAIHILILSGLQASLQASASLYI